MVLQKTSKRDVTPLVKSIIISSEKEKKKIIKLKMVVISLIEFLFTILCRKIDSKFGKKIKIVLMAPPHTFQ